jgi:hypothetical protein
MAGPLGVNAKPFSGAYPSKNKVPCNYSRWMNFGLSNGTTGIGGTSRVAFVAPYAMHDLVVDFYNINENNGETVANQTFGLIFRAVLEYPANTFYFLTVNGRGSPYPGEEALYLNILQKVTTDPVGVSIPAGATFWVRSYLQVPYAPTFNSVTTSITGGALAAATYYYSVTALCGSGKIVSPASAGLNVTTTGSTSSNTLTITAALPADAAGTPVAYNIYRSTFSSGTVTYFTTIPAEPGVTTWVDSGLTQPVTPATQGPVVITAATYPTGPCTMNLPVSAGPTPPISGCNYKEYTGGTGTNQLLTSGTGWFASGSTGNTAMWGPCDVRGTPDQGLDVPIVLTVGDSIISGTGDVYDRGYIHGTLVSNKIAYFNRSKLGEYATQWNAPYAPQRIQFPAGVSDIFEELNTNDISIFGTPPVVVENNDILRWCEFRRRGPAGSIFPRIWRMTLLPRVATSDSLATYTNQQPGGLSIASATNATPIVLGIGTYLGAVGSPPVTTASAQANSGATSLSVTSATGIGTNSAGNASLAGQAFQAGGATYVVTSVSGTTVNFTPALTSTISSGQSLVFGTTSPAGAALGTTSVGVGYTGFQVTCDTANASNVVFVGQVFTVGSNTYTVTAVNYTTNTVTFTPALTGTAIAAGGYINFQSQITIRNGLGNTALNGTFYPATSVNVVSLYSDNLYQSPVAGNGTYTANSALMSRNQTETNRETYNTWVRAGCPLIYGGTAAQVTQWNAANYTPVAPGTSGAIVAGQPGHPAFGTFDPAGQVEYNSSGVLTFNGGYWEANASPFYYSIDGTHPSQNSYVALSASVPISAIVAP